MTILKRTRHLGMSEAVRAERQSCIGGSDARIIMSGDQEKIESLWRQKRGEQEGDDLSEVLVVQLGNVTENLNTDWFEMQTGMVVTGEQTRPAYSEWPVAMSTLDGIVRDTEDGPALGVFEAKFMLPFYWTPQKALDKYYHQLSHNTMVTGHERAWLSVITGAGNYVQMIVDIDPFQQMALLEAEQDFWDCVQTGRRPGAPEVDTPEVVPVKILDMTGSNEWATHAFDFCDTKDAVTRHEKAKKKLKTLFPADVLRASGHGIAMSRTASNAVQIKLAA